MEWGLAMEFELPPRLGGYALGKVTLNESLAIYDGMLFCDAPAIRDVLLFPQMKPEAVTRADIEAQVGGVMTDNAAASLDAIAADSEVGASPVPVPAPPADPKPEPEPGPAPELEPAPVAVELSRAAVDAIEADMSLLTKATVISVSERRAVVNIYVDGRGFQLKPVSQLMYKGYQVTFAQNLTDVDDKIINRAIEQGRTASDVADEFSAAFIEQMHRFGILDPDVRPRATQEIAAMQEMIRVLIERGNAYAVPSGDVYFSVRSDHGLLRGWR